MEVVWHSISQSSDYIVDQGTSGLWYYRKWANGWAECWCELTTSCEATSAFGSLYYVSKGSYTFPFTFKLAPNMQASIFMGDGLWNISIHSLTASTFHCYAQSATSKTGTPTFLFNASGWWK